MHVSNLTFDKLLEIDVQLTLIIHMFLCFDYCFDNFACHALCIVIDPCHASFSFYALIICHGTFDTCILLLHDLYSFLFLPCHFKFCVCLFHTIKD